MKNAIWWFFLALLGIGIGAGLHLLFQYEGQLPPLLHIKSPPTPKEKVEQSEVEEPVIRHPIEQVQLLPAEQDKSDTPEPEVQEEPLPPLDQSDDTIRASLEGILDQEPVGAFFVAKNLIRRIVSTVDNLMRDKVSLKVRVMKPVAGQFLVSGEEGSYTINRDNTARYSAYVPLAEAVDIESLVAIYVRFYPLFQQAYLDLGYPSGYFNDRLVEVIDNLLAAPDVQGPIKLVRPHVLYRFADPKLEALSAGQKMLVRMGSENASRIKAKLREIRRHLTAQVIEQTPLFPR